MKATPRRQVLKSLRHSRVLIHLNNHTYRRAYSTPASKKWRSLLTLWKGASQLTTKTTRVRSTHRLSSEWRSHHSRRLARLTLQTRWIRIRVKRFPSIISWSLQKRHPLSRSQERRMQWWPLNSSLLEFSKTSTIRRMTNSNNNQQVDLLPRSIIRRMTWFRAARRRMTNSGKN